MLDLIQEIIPFFFSNYFKKVYSFEPNTFSFKLLKLNTINQQNIKIYNFGLSDKNQIKNFYSYESNYGGSSVKKARICTTWVHGEPHAKAG